MVDEYQDTNEVQDRIFEALTRERGNCFLVGDVKQSIYRFRLADPGIFLKKYREFVPAGEANPGQGRKILLSENFRSGGEILEAANHVFRCTMSTSVGGLEYGEAEALREGVPHLPLPQCPVEFHGIQLTPGPGGETAVKYEAEAQFVAERIDQLLREPAMIRQGEALRPVRPGDIVILLRSPGQLRPVLPERPGGPGHSCFGRCRRQYAGYRGGGGASLLSSGVGQSAPGHSPGGGVGQPGVPVYRRPFGENPGGLSGRPAV